MKHAWSAWGKPAKAVRQVRLRFGEGMPRKSLGNLSAGARLDDSLFLAADEFTAIDRLTRGKKHNWAKHTSFELADFLPLRDAGGEADLEGLAADNGWLWLVGSHARTRPKPEKMPGECIDLDRLANLKDTRSRCLLARLPLVRDGAGWRPVRRDGERQAGMVAQTEDGNALAKAIEDDPLLAPFALVPAKEGGVDIEGIAVCGNRVALGMRGPVIGTHALLLEIEIAPQQSGELTIARGPVRRLLAMEGLGIRDLKRLGDDLLILAGPSTGLSGPCAIYRWRNWAHDPAHDPSKVHLHRPDRILELPFGRGEDHPEGLAAWSQAGKSGADRILVICDSPAKERMDHDAGTILADVFELPG
jgi:hypothetical protein